MVLWGVADALLMWCPSSLKGTRRLFRVSIACGSAQLWLGSQRQPYLQSLTGDVSAVSEGQSVVLLMCGPAILTGASCLQPVK